MKVTFFLGRFPIPSETFVLNQITSLINLGHEVSIVAVWSGANDYKHKNYFDYNLRDKTHYLLPNEKKGTLAKTLNRLLSIIGHLGRKQVRVAMDNRRFGAHAKSLLLPAVIAQNPPQSPADVIIAHFGIEGVLAMKLCELGLLKGAICTVFHGIDISQTDILQRYQTDYQRLFKETELLMPISYLWKTKLEKMGCPADKVKVFRMGVNVNDYNYQPRTLAHDRLEIISVARLMEKKGLDVAIKACALLKSRNVDFRYRIVGHGPLADKMRALVDELNLNDRVTLLGFQPQHKVKELLAESDIFMLPSVTGADGDMEGIPVALMEAMAVGLPVVSTFHSGIPELIEHQKSGWLAPEYDSEALANIIENILNNKGSLRQMLDHARDKIETEFNEDITNQELSKSLVRSFT
ncbi:GDP-mannose-dependent alpha-(1-6)-phosphatidylinositol monomannoside mannosyltransferase [Sodalis glossinidius str. 'morsitans']|uniref:GDP-mannose-dependent alpha-(1-6)-phosphatidylinositol monomannoside mannosyltransferase n=1 Tax=Sodalis glossinidius (strain morsitans) TaxID=343509 RepID=A0A193QI36_SODGM|nr:glycosyltransferase [Sodalis glossinidius]CRL44842.1 GDP-mannose-dependent alpha-(1-6)-phosphatidylinositol monomannoside mannosyltransferase [Sodalis glossinidius str. 'morsitans']